MIGSGLVDRIQLSPNVEARLNGAKPRLIVLHYTGMASGRSAVDWLCNPASKVSCHYLVDEDGTIVQMVDESQRAWHAGARRAGYPGAIDRGARRLDILVNDDVRLWALEPGARACCPWPGPRTAIRS